MKGAVFAVTVAIVVLFFLAAPASAQVNGAWGPWSDCTKLCDAGDSFRSCNNPAPSGGGADCPSTTSNHMTCNPQACVNCTTTPFWWQSQCTKTCGGGTKWYARRIIQAPGSGGTPCGVLNYTDVCNTWMCQGTIQSYGYAVFGPLAGPGPLTYTFARGNEDIDVFLFDQTNYDQYVYDAQRTKPFQTNYAPLRSSLDIDTVASDGPITLDSTTNYYLVVDHTYIGAATGTANGNGGFTFNPNTFYFYINGLNYGTVAYSGQVGMSAASPAATISAAAVLLATAVAAMLL